MPTIKSTSSAAVSPFEDAGFDEAQLATGSFLARYSGRALEACRRIDAWVSDCTELGMFLAAADTTTPSTKRSQCCTA